MARFVVLFQNDRGFGIQPVQALDSGHAADVVQAQHPGSRLAVIAAEQLEGVGAAERRQLLADWIRGGGP